jgi:predicted dehydrogenase
MSTDRRDFIRAGAFLTAASYSRILGANDRLRVGGIGVGGRGTYDLKLHSQAGCEVVGVCDVYEPHRLRVKADFAPDAKEYVEYRELLDRKDVDAVVIGAPDHWHAPMVTDAVRAGKDVYVEKPVTHTLEEGAALVKAVEDSGRVVQVGYQQRSWPHFLEAREIIASGALGQITMVLTFWYQNHLGEGAPDTSVDPSKLDWKRWLGSAPDQPFDVRRFRSWRWYWDFGGGAFTDLFSHWVDVVHWFMGEDTPRAVQAMGEKYVLPKFECPDTQSAYLEYPRFAVSYLGTLIGYLEGGGLMFRGTKAMLRIHRNGYWLYPEQAGYSESPTSAQPEREARCTKDGTPDHVQNFLDCIRSRKTPNANIRNSVASAGAGHLANIAMRSGKTVRYPEDIPA